LQQCWGVAFVVETIFAWPGVGRRVVEAVFSCDDPVVQAGVLFTSILSVLSHLPDTTTDPRKAADALEAILLPAVARQSAAAMLEEGQRSRLLVPTMADGLATPHGRVRGRLAAFNGRGPGGRGARPARSARRAWRWRGAHNARVLGPMPGLGAAEVAGLEAEGIIGTRAI
jgi:hypothetical protein